MVAMNKFELAEYIIGKFPGEVTPMKLQKLAYYCYVWQLVAEENLFTAHFKAWEYGPVDEELYHKYKKYGKSAIQNESPVISKKPVHPVIDFILDSYAVYSAIELSKTSHMEKPWKLYKNSFEPIPDKTLKEFYSKQPFSWNFPLTEDKPFYPPKTASHFAFTFDMDKDYVPVFDNLDEYVNAFGSGKQKFNEIMKNALQN